MSGLARFWRGPSSEGGQALVLIAITLLGMLMAVGLAIDSGQLFVARRTAQEAADAGAYAGAVYIYQQGENPPSAATQAAAAAAATYDVQRNGFSGDCANGSPTKVCVTVGTYQSDPHYVEVTIETQVRTSLVPAQSGLTTVRVRAVAGAVPLNNGYALMSLNRNNTDRALDVEANGRVTVTGAGILVNSTSPTGAYDVCSSTCPNVSSTGPINVAGNWSGSGWSPTPASGTTQQPDPFAGYAKPSTTGLPVYTTLPTPVNGAVTLNPGVYKVAISYAGSTDVTLTTGTYIIEAGMNGAGNLDFQSGAGGVFIFNTLMNYPNPGVGDTCGGVRLTGNSETSLSPLASGPYANLLFYQDPACTQTFTIAGNGILTAHGTIYAPKAQVVLNGNNATLDGSQVVADTISVQSGNVTINFSTGSTAQPILPRLAQ